MSQPPRKCSSCGTEAPAGAQHCANPRCRRALPGNQIARTTGRYSQVPDTTIKLSADELEANLIADLGGDLTTLERAYVKKLKDTWILSSVLVNDMVSHGVVTPGGGKVRPSFFGFVTSLQVFDRYAQRLGMKRRQKHIDPLVVLEQAIEEANRS